MAHTFTTLYTHIVFGTKYREAMIRETEPMHAYLGGIVRGLDGIPLKIGGISDHVHMLVRFKATIAIADAVEKIKSSSSKWMNEQMAARFQWQKGYAAFSVSPTSVDAVTKYIGNQVRHHKRVTFHDEYIKLLKECGINYDSRYVFE